MSSEATYRKQRHQRFKKRSGFWTKLNDEAEVVSGRGEASSPVSLATASGKKLALSRPSTSTGESSHGACSSDSLCEMKGLRLIDLESLLASVSRRAICNVCNSPLTVKENLVLRRGICTKLTLSCTNLYCAGSDDAFCDPSKHSKASNTRLILAGKMCGRGRAGLETISGFMGLPPPLTYRAFSDYNLSINKVIQEATIESQLSASAHLHSLYDTKPNDVIDITVTCDGTWSKRGYTAFYGVSIVMSWDSGQVLDAVALSSVLFVSRRRAPWKSRSTLIGLRCTRSPVMRTTLAHHQRWRLKLHLASLLVQSSGLDSVTKEWFVMEIPSLLCGSIMSSLMEAMSWLR